MRRRYRGRGGSRDTERDRGRKEGGQPRAYRVVEGRVQHERERKTAKDRNTERQRQTDRDIDIFEVIR